MERHFASLFLTIAFAVAANAGSPGSASYSVSTDSIDAGGGRAASAPYSNHGSLGGIAGISTVAAPAEISRHGYIGQLFEVRSLVISANRPDATSPSALA